MNISELIPYVATAGVSWLVSALAAPKIFDHYLSSNAAKKLEDFKSRIGQWSDRRTRSNDNEYKAAIDCWKSLYYAFVEVDTMQSPKISLLIAAINDEEKEIILKNTGHKEDEIRRILNSSDPQMELNKVRAEKEIVSGIDKLNDAKKIVEENSIFINDCIYKKITRLIAVLRSSVFMYRNEILFGRFIPDHDSSFTHYENAKKNSRGYQKRSER